MPLRTGRPHVDDYAINSSQSVNALKTLLYEGTGFILRPDYPDYGCDFVAELIIDSQARNWRFPIQVKSIETPKVIDNGNFVSYNFTLSRLGYLLDHKPEMGLVVLFSVEDNKVYYDFADQIYYRLKDLHPDDAWEMQESANIRIPVENELTVANVKLLHQKMYEAFTLFTQMYQDNADEYKLPNTNKVSNPKPALSQQEFAEAKLKEFGVALLQQNEINLLLEMISILPTGKLVSSPELSVLAGMVYHEVGMYIDAEYYLEKGMNGRILTPFLSLSGEWTRLKNDFSRFKISRKEYVSRLEKLEATTDPTEEHNKLLFQLNLVHHRIQEYNMLERQIKQDEKDFDRLEEAIVSLNAPFNQKAFLSLMNASNLSLYIHRLHMARMATIIALAGNVTAFPLEERIVLAKDIIFLTKKFHQIVAKITNEAREKEEKYIEAEGYSLNADHSLELTFQSLSIPDALKNFEKSLLSTAYISRHVHAAQLYFDSSHMGKSYQQLCNALEWIYLYEYFKLSYDISKQKIEKNCAVVREILQVPIYELQAKKIIENLQVLNSKDSVAPNIVPDMQIGDF